METERTWQKAGSNQEVRKEKVEIIGKDTHGGQTLWKGIIGVRLWGEGGEEKDCPGGIYIDSTRNKQNS